MLERSLRLFRPFGIDVMVHWSWLLLAFLITSSLATGWFPILVPGHNESAYWFAGLLGAIGLFLSIVVHEFCHALVGRYYEMPVERITLFLFGGVAQMDEEPPTPKAEFNMAIAGPISSVILAFIFFGLFSLSANFGAAPLFQAALSYLASINVVVAAFNMLPGFPLDGGRCLRAVLWGLKKDLVWATRIASNIGQGFGGLLIIFGFINLFSGAGLSGVWLFMIGFLLVTFARSSYIQVLIRQSLHGKPASTFMNTTPLTATPDMQVSDLIRNSINETDQGLYPVIEKGGDFLGCVDLDAAKKLPEKEWPSHQISEIVQSCKSDLRIEPEEDAEKALNRMAKTGSRALLVMRDNQLLGILTQSALMRYLSLKTT